MTRRYLIFICLLTFFFTHTGLYGQKQDNTSLIAAIKKSNHDTERVTLLRKLARNIAESDPDSALYLYNQVIKICQKETQKLTITTGDVDVSLRKIFQKKLGKVEYDIGLFYYSKGEPKLSLEYCKKAFFTFSKTQSLKEMGRCANAIAIQYKLLDQTQESMAWYQKSFQIAKVSKDTSMLANYYNGMGVIFYSMGKIPESLKAYDKAVKTFESMNDKYSAAMVLSNISEINVEQGQHKEALNSYKNALKINTELGNKRGISICLYNVGSVYLKLNEVEKALEYFQKSLELRMELGDKIYIAASLSSIGEVYSEKGRYNEAAIYFKRALQMAKEVSSKEGELQALSDLASLYLNQNNINEALNYAKKSIVVSKEIGNPSDIMVSAKTLKDVFKKMGNYKDALEMEELRVKMHDSIVNVNNRDESYKFNIKYDYDKKALADSIKLVDQKKIDMAALKEKDAKLNQQRTQRWALIGGLGLMLIFSIVIFNRYKITQKQKSIIESQKKLVDDSQKKTIDSINYAKKIQHSILPPKEELDTRFPENFVFYKPKDIISGDFYLFLKKENLSYIAVADCTGHGVPGALMTMVAYSNLIEIISNSNLEAGEILSRLHTQIFNKLQQNKGDDYSQDGLDISIVIIDENEKTMKFSGARNHGYVVRDNEVSTLKANSRSIGGLSGLGEIEPERNFDTVTTDIKKGDVLILTTDGIIDQLNQKDEKFGYIRFKDLLLEVCQTNLTQGEEIMDNYFSRWKGKLTQLDDLLVIGFKI